MHRQPVFQRCAVVGGGVAEELFEHGLCLPSGCNLSEADLSRVVEVARRMHIDGECCMLGYETGLAGLAIFRAMT